MIYDFEILKKIRFKLNEISIQRKPIFGSGMEHKLYPSIKYPDRLIKIGEKDVVEEWVELFKSNPELFPKVHRMGESRDKKYFWVEIEKVDTQRAKDEWQELEDLLELYDFIDPEGGTYGRDLTDIYLDFGDKKSEMQQILKKMKEQNKETFDLFTKWFNFFKKCEKAKSKFVGHETLIDAHRYNFGYNENGQLKCIDP